MGAALPLVGEAGYPAPADASTAPIAAAASGGNVASALSAMSAVGAAAVATATNRAVAQFLDELTPYLARPMTTHQREVLAETLVDLVDARVAAAQLD